MDLLKAEIAKKRKQLEASKVVAPESGKKFFKREDLIKRQEEEYWKKHRKDDSTHSKETKEESKRRESTETMDPNLVTLSRQEVIKRLRERQEPIRLFGETDAEAFFRLRRYEMLAPEINKGLRNDFKEAMDKVDQQYLEEMVKLQGEDVPNRAYDIKYEDDGSTIDDIIEMSAGMGQGDEQLDGRVITWFIKFLLKMWAQELNRREEHVKRSNRGKLESATYSQTKAYLQPLLRKLKKQSLAPDLLESLVNIIRYMLDRDYVKASDTYLQMAIGNAPWPIGVTMVGIHARTGREKIFSKNVAHVLNDETQRKFIQALKRLMTQCQRHFPTDPSKSVEYVKSDIIEH
ncbi:pre-mRNA-splicing factor 18-like [Acanthaster planci]|uniref:Pre-mRNA-splicing factor 18 n=1 Tax=Acanthaster planci TaxID=133434 RepID=A0A8B7ZGC4_ACAPL|nr:pre-mRNA-splicing factor 18-like [Acanthaster planci]